MTLRDRIGVDLGGRRRLEDGLAWAAAHDVHYVDVCLEGAPDHPNAPQYLRTYVDLAGRLGAEWIVIHGGYHFTGDFAARLADSHGRYEQHLRPGEGTIDFARMFARIEGGGYRGHYMMAFGSLDDIVEGRERLVRAASG